VDASVGRHRSATEALPRLLDELDDRGLVATFFVEAINCELNPDAVRQIAARGHELGMHGWRHEAWAGLSADRERSLTERGVSAFSGLDVPVTGFRPPGGGLNPASPGLLREAGLRWCSPEGGRFEERDGLAYVPFQWELVDAYYLMDEFAELRASRGDPRAPLSPGEAEQRVLERLDGDGMQTLILHPFLMLEPDWWASVRRVLARVADGGMSVAPGGAVAAAIAS
jgi:peptidoglycan/xylan/chitin deacetylase (PgdA/CDA1 family)